MISAQTAAFLEPGRALIIGTVDREGEPIATRGWGITTIPDTGALRLVLDASDDRALDALRATGVIAITASDVPTLQSMQLKGRAANFGPATIDDHALVVRYIDAFFDAVGSADGIPRSLLERIVPNDYIACEVVVERLFDQTPGPRAGTALADPPA
jgi:hypothetical protein